MATPSLPPGTPLWQTIVGLSLSATIVGSLLSWVGDWFKRRAELRNEQTRREAELKKWRAEFYIRPKLEALRKLHEALVKSHYGINMKGSDTSVPKTLSEYKTTIEALEIEFFEAFTMAAVYLDQPAIDAMKKFLGCVRQMSTSIWTRLPENQGRERESPEFRPFHDSYDEAHAVLKGLLNPSELLKEIER